MICWSCGKPIILIDLKGLRFPEKIQRYRSLFKRYIIWAFVSIPIMGGLFFVLSLGGLLTVTFITRDLSAVLAVSFYYMLLFLMVGCSIPVGFLIPSFYGLIKWWFQRPKYLENLITKFPPPNPSDCPREYDFFEGLGVQFRYCPFCYFINPTDSEFRQDCGKEISDQIERGRIESTSRGEK